MSLVPILANGFCANPTAQQERARALYSTSRSLMCDGVVANVCDKPDGCLKVLVTKCIETPEELSKELKIPNPDIEDVKMLLETKTRYRIGILHTPAISMNTEVVFAEHALDNLTSFSKQNDNPLVLTAL